MTPEESLPSNDPSMGSSPTLTSIIMPQPILFRRVTIHQSEVLTPPPTRASPRLHHQKLPISFGGANCASSFCRQTTHPQSIGASAALQLTRAVHVRREKLYSLGKGSVFSTNLLTKANAWSAIAFQRRIPHQRTLRRESQPSVRQRTSPTVERRINKRRPKRSASSANASKAKLTRHSSTNTLMLTNASSR